MQSLPRRLPIPALLLVAACTASTEESHGPPPLLTALPRALSPAESRMVNAGNQFGFDLLREARSGTPEDNLFLSPVSVSMALGMTLNGAAGTTFDSMRVALRLAGAPIEEINQGYRSLIDLLQSLDASSQFQIANSIWAHSGIPFLPAFLTAAQTNFDAEVRALDFHAPATLGTINDWVGTKTNGKIPAILDQISADEVMFLINAIYFKGSWRLAFDPKQTQNAPFQTSDGTVQSVRTMNLRPELQRYSATRDFEIVELLYGNGAFAMTIVLPRADRTLADVTEGLDATRWAEWVADLHDREIGLALPRFRLEYQRLLNDDLKALGMGIGFDPLRADFTGMADVAPERLFITKVTHKTFVDVNEEGTEAAAATSVGIGITSLPPTMQINRPFLFAIRERLTGTILFLGQITRVP
jgi:serine protease inhibitor